MKPVDSSDHRVDRDIVVGLTWIGCRHSGTDTLTVSIPDTSRELIQQTPRVDLRVLTTPEDKNILTEATTIHERIDRVNHALAIQVRALSTDRPLLHTHLQRVASCLPVYRSGGGVC
jgi:hypothetical protein